MNHVISHNDKFSVNENSHLGGFRGRVMIGKASGLYQKILNGPYGPVATSEFKPGFLIADEDNVMTIGGYQFAFNKLFNIALDDQSTLRVGDLNDEAPQMRIGVDRKDYKSDKYDAEISLTDSSIAANGGINISAMNYVFGFMVGDGGSKEDNITVIAPNYKNRGLFHAIPFRMSNDGYNNGKVPAGIYYGKSVSAASATTEEITSYYVKRFSDPAPHIVHCWVTDNPDEMDIVDDTVFSSQSSVPIESYAEMNLTISEADCRGYFTTNGTTPRINEFGLVSGWYNAEKDDYEHLRLQTHFCRSSITLDDGDSIAVVYRLYAR